jgi:hypothetical protein
LVLPMLQIKRSRSYQISGRVRNLIGKPNYPKRTQKKTPKRPSIEFPQNISTYLKLYRVSKEKTEAEDRCL